MSQPAALPPEPPVPARFQTARSTLLVDRFMNHFIKVGGIGIITVVFGIFFFILWQVLPLFGGARVSEYKTVPLPPGDYRVLGLDEYAELPFLLDTQGRFTFLDLTGGDGSPRVVPPPFAQPKTFTAFRYNPERRELACGTADGQFALATVDYQTSFKTGRRTMQAEVSAGPLLPVGQPGHPIRAVAYGDAGDYKLAAAIQEVEGRTELRAATLVQERTLFGAGEITVKDTINLSSNVTGKLEFLLVNRQADGIVAATREGEVFYFYRQGDTLTLRQQFKPFADRPDPGIAKMEFLLGDVTLVFSGVNGENRLFSLYVTPGRNERLFGQTKEFPSLPGPANYYAAGQRNKAFLIGHQYTASLRYSTTEKVRWEHALDYPVTHAALNSKYDRIALLDTNHTLHLFELRDPHPEASFKAMFGKLWYEGADRPQYVWQSTGGSDTFEPKLSLIPLIIGTLKGTLYAMLFAVPIALLAALYTSQFAHPHFRVIFKPVMEIMASLPSVVLGFLAALWLAPLIENRVPSILLMVVVVPVVALVFGQGWASLPIQYRARIRPGFEFLVFLPLFLAAVWACWHLGPAFERVAFVVTDPATGRSIADFRLWWPQFTGADFQQRNSLVVGFVMGFTVIPIVFTIAEDALSNVPATLRSGSLALGASRWQTALRIIVPTASAGIFSALMVGLGRAVGETMIVVMATGNTPIMDLNIFSGMRTLSANIAVELPEAPHHGTLYRTLFLGALVLFLMTFVLNTVAEVLRQRLRERYKLV
ncbi:MAG: ABC transporter permease subunit [Limisphaerales bacterium]